MANKEGKKFEEDFKKSVPPDMWCYRFPDSTAAWGGDDGGKTRFQAENICDFEIFFYGLFLIETKSHMGKSITHQVFKYQGGKKKGQIKHLYELVAAMAFGINADVVINMRQIGETYSLPADVVLNHILNSGIKSIPIAFMRENGYRLKQELKRTRYRYDVKDLIENIRKEGI